MKPILFVSAIWILAVTGISGQSPQSAAPVSPPSTAVPLKRVPPATKPASAEPIPTPDKYPLGDLVHILQTGDGPSPPATPRVEKAQQQAQPNLGVPKDYQPSKEVPLTPAARQAIQVSAAWMSSQQTPVEGKDGKVLYTYGAGLPTMVCAPLRVCVLELQPGERIVGEPQIGDSVRWIVSPANAGKDDLAVAMIVIKPKAAGLDTNLFVTTDRRAYYLRLISKAEDYIARVAFAYPDDSEAKWKAYLVREQQDRLRAEHEASEIAPIETLENLYLDYTIEGRDVNIRPIHVVDDGKKTYIQMPPETAHRELPMLAIVGPDGQAQLVNYRVKGDMYIVDRIFDRGALILGTGKTAHRAEISRGSFHGKKSKNDPFAKISDSSALPATVPSSNPSGDASAKKPVEQEHQP